MFVRGTNSISDENAVRGARSGVMTRRASLQASKLASKASSTPVDDSPKPPWKQSDGCLDEASTPPCTPHLDEDRSLKEPSEKCGNADEEKEQLKCQLAMAIEEQQMLHFLSEVQRQQLENQESLHRVEMSNFESKYEKDITELKTFAEALGTQLKQALRTALQKVKSLENEVETLNEMGLTRSDEINERVLRAAVKTEHV